MKTEKFELETCTKYWITNTESKQTEWTQFRLGLEKLINKYSIDNAMDTPDYVLAQWICETMGAFQIGMALRDKHKGLD